jgi:hypothetical protein
MTVRMHIYNSAKTTNNYSLLKWKCYSFLRLIDELLNNNEYLLLSQGQQIMNSMVLKNN